MYYNMTNKELLDAYNASAEYDESMCCEICTRVGMHEEYYIADGENIDRVMEEAVEQLRQVAERGDIMKLENLIDALKSMMNLSSKTEMRICDEAGNDLWKGRLAKFDNKSWFGREIVMWYFSDVTNSVTILVNW